MTTITDMVDDVRMLELEIRKLELNRRIAQLKTDPLIDERCIGCAGYCGVAKLQEEIDKLRHIVENRNETVSDLLHNDNRLNMSINEYKEMIKSRDKTIECLKAELSSRGEDSKVLIDVVDAIRDWDADPTSPRNTIGWIKHLIEDYLDVPVPSDEEHCVTVKVGFMEL